MENNPTQENKHIHPIFTTILQRQDKETLLQQHALVLWFTGLSGAGKSTIANALERLLHQNGIVTCLLDGDNIRMGLNNNLGFSEADRTENIRRIAETAKLFLQNGIVTLCSFVSPTEDLRQLARQIIGPNDFFEIFIHAPLAVCEQRDVKGLYQKARAGQIPNFTGISAPFEPPQNPNLILATDQLSIEKAVQQTFEAIIERIKN